LAKNSVEEKERLLAKNAKLKEELTNQNEEFTQKVEACKKDVAQAFLVGFEVAVEQASGLHLTLDFSELGLGKTVVNGQLIEE